MSKHQNDRHEDSCSLVCDAGFEGATTCATYAGRHRQTRCGHIVGPIPKLNGEVLVCVLPTGHLSDHASADGAWWIREEDGLHGHYEVTA